ncbi:MAG TPA: SPOR domain-containing protein, partial [Methyloceanibacter sp.]|nr:SPOR domain-containing protein [Methyloceanibacter sp.]
AAPIPPPVTTSEPGEDDADANKSNIPPPVTVSEADEPPAEEPAPSSNLSAPTPPQPSEPSAPEAASTAAPAATESASLDPVALPPAANDGSTRYGIEIGTVAKQDGLRPLWRTFLTNHAALVAGLQPRRVLAPDKKWRLIAGPFANAAEANQACALFKKASQPCEATVYAGDSL